jgi:O-antigen ligase
MVAKDSSYLGDRYIMRGFAQGLCLVAGSLVLLPRLTPELLFRYWPLLLYLGYLSVISITSGFDVLFQVGSLAAIIIFAIAYMESKVDAENAVIATSTAVAYGAATIGSLIIASFMPALAYEQSISSDHRFQGLFSEPGMMAAASGVLTGVGLFGVKRWWAKLLTLTPALLCLVLTGSRTFWLAALVAALVSAWWCYPGMRKSLLVISAVIALSIPILALFSVSVNNDTTKRILREDSISTLTGRVGVWGAAYEAWSAKPFLGYGYTHGSDGLLSLGRKLHKYLTEAQVLTLLGSNTISFSIHSGYIQALVDTGIIGASLYLIVIISSLLRIFLNGAVNKRPLEQYLLIFLVIANFSETVIYTASVFNSILFWYLAVFAHSLRRGTETTETARGRP